MTRMLVRASRRIAGLMLLVVALASPSSAHEIRPAYLEISDLPGDTVQVLWRQPVAGDTALALRPVLSSGWLDREPDRRWSSLDSVTRAWTIPAPHAPLAGQQLRIDGLEGTLTDVLVGIQTGRDTESTALLSPAAPSMTIGAQVTSRRVVPAYLRLGIEHIFSGVDHLLYLLGLILLIRGWRPLLAAITAFTAAHSLTLAAASLGWVRVDGAAVEACIALSILYVAVALTRVTQGVADRAGRRPWLVAFAFGLLHGFGFAGALREVGVPRDSLVPALLSFNLGIEAGQVIFAATVLGVLAAARRYAPRAATPARRLAPHAIGIAAAFWLIERVAALG